MSPQHTPGPRCTCGAGTDPKEQHVYGCQLYRDPDDAAVDPNRVWWCGICGSRKHNTAKHDVARAAIARARGES